MTRCKLRTTATAIALISFSAFAASSHAQNAGAGKVPELNMQPSCEAAAKEDLVLEDKPSIQSCMDEEQAARQKLQGAWATFPAGDKRECTTANKTGGPPSYVNLLWCLQDAKTARELDKKPS